MKQIEHNHQVALFEWMATCCVSELNHPVRPNARLSDYACASANGGSRNAKEAANLKASGVSAGFPDVQICLPVGRYSGLFIEMKRPIVKGESKPVLSDLQRQWGERLNHAGYLCVVCYGFDQAKEIITRYMACKL